MRTETMNLQELQEHAITVTEKINEQFDLNGDERVKLLAHMAKVSEEVGELSEEILTHLKLQREEKLAAAEKENLAKEVADVIFATCTLAADLNIDLDKVITERIALVKKRNLK